MEEKRSFLYHLLTVRNNCIRAKYICVNRNVLQIIGLNIGHIFQFVDLNLLLINNNSSYQNINRLWSIFNLIFQRYSWNWFGCIMHRNQLRNIISQYMSGNLKYIVNEENNSIAYCVSFFVFVLCIMHVYR